MNELDLRSWVVALGEARGGTFDYGLMDWKEPPVPDGMKA